MTDQLDIQKYLDVLDKFKWYGIIPACAVIMVLAIASAFLPKVYESSCIVEVERGSIENPLKTQRDRPPALAEQLTIFSESALKWDILSRVADKIGGQTIVQNSDRYGLLKLRGKLGLGGKYAGDEQQAQKETVIALLRDGIAFKQKNPSFLILSYQGVRSDVNANILNTLVSTLIEEKTKSELSTAGQNYEFIKAEMESYRKKLEEAEGQLKEFKQQHISELPNNMNVNLSQLANDKSELLACELEMKELDARIKYIDEELKKQDQVVVSEVRREANPMLSVLSQRIVDMEIELTSLRVNYTELHPRIVELESQLEDLKQQRTRVESETVGSETSSLNPVYQQLVQDKQNALVQIEVRKNRMANLAKRIDEYEESVKSIPAQEQQLLTLTRNYEVTANIYNMFLQKFEEVRLQEKLAGEGKDKESFKVLEYARATMIPVSPQRLRLLMVILVAGIGTGAGVICGMSYFDDSFKTLEEARNFIKKPFLGTIPALNGNGKSRKFLLLEKWQKWIRPADKV
jgi:polysaccharide chain length determinant protein (PEP-CTERM system associated)